MRLSPARWARLESLFHRAAGLGSGEQARFIEAECADDPEMGQELASLLQAVGRTPEGLRVAQDLVSRAIETHTSRMRRSGEP
ncbi:MAG: hypothetical protein R3E10_06870 [Gemmatimonadota bacterium]